MIPFFSRGKAVSGKTLNVGIYGLAVLPIDYLSRVGCPVEQVCSDQRVDPAYHGVFTSGIKAYQLVTYRELVRSHYGRGVANQVGHYQQRLLQKEPEGRELHDSLTLVDAALQSETVSADSMEGVIDIPIEMNIALSLLLGATSSPHYAIDLDRRVQTMSELGKDVDWVLSRCLLRARDNMENVFSPLLSCIGSGVRMDYLQSWLDEQRVAH